LGIARELQEPKEPEDTQHAQVDAEEDTDNARREGKEIHHHHRPQHEQCAAPPGALRRHPRILDRRPHAQAIFAGVDRQRKLLKRDEERVESVREGRNGFQRHRRDIGDDQHDETYFDHPPGDALRLALFEKGMDPLARASPLRCHYGIVHGCSPLRDS
jgi:hypothetical protein